MFPSQPFANHHNRASAAIKRSCQGPHAFSRIESTSDFKNIVISKSAIRIAFSNRHSTINHSVIAVLLICNPLKILGSVIGLYRVFMVNGYLPASILTGRRLKKGKRDKFVNYDDLGFPTVLTYPPQSKLLVPSTVRMLAHYHKWPCVTAAVWSRQPSYLALIGDFIRQNLSIQNYTPPRLSHTRSMRWRPNAVKAA
jgi:hypothetical protein